MTVLAPLSPPAQDLRVRSLPWDAVDRGRWESILDACPDAGWFETPEWMGILCRTFPDWRGRVLVAEDAGGRTLGILPFVIVRHFGVQTALSMPFGTAGGPLIPGAGGLEPAGPRSPSRDNPEAVDDAAEVAGALCRSFLREAAPWNSRGAQMIDLENRALRALPPEARSPFRLESATRLVLDLAGGPEEVRARRFEPQRRRQARCADRRGLTVTAAEGESDFADFLKLYAAVSRTWHTRCRLPRDFFEEIRRSPSPRILLLVARHGGELVAGNLAFFYRQSAVSWCGVMRKDLGDLHPAVALHAETIARACAAGCLTYDLGPSPALPRVERFKRQFGAEPAPYRSWTVLGPLGRVLERWRPALLRLPSPRGRVGE